MLFAVYYSSLLVLLVLELLITSFLARICKPVKESRNRFPAWRAGTPSTFDVPATRLHRLAGFLNVYKFGLCIICLVWPWLLTLVCFYDFLPFIFFCYLYVVYFWIFFIPIPPYRTQKLAAGVIRFTKDHPAIRNTYFFVNPYQNDQGWKGPCFFQRFIALKLKKSKGWFCPWPFCMWGINVTNTRIFCALRHPACGGVIPASPSPRASKKRDHVMGPPPPPPAMGRGGGGDR